MASSSREDPEEVGDIKSVVWKQRDERQCLLHSLTPLILFSHPTGWHGPQAYVSSVNLS